MGHESRRSAADFHIAFNALLDNARLYGIDTTIEGMSEFLTAMAEVKAEDAATIRWLYNIVHRCGTTK